MEKAVTDNEYTKPGREMPTVNANKSSLAKLCRNIDNSQFEKSKVRGRDPSLPKLFINSKNSTVVPSEVDIGNPRQLIPQTSNRLPDRARDFSDRKLPEFEDSNANRALSTHAKLRRDVSNSKCVAASTNKEYTKSVHAMPKANTVKPTRKNCWTKRANPGCKKSKSGINDSHRAKDLRDKFESR